MGKRRSKYEGGDWAIGACKPYRPPHTLSAIELAQRAKEVREHYLPYAERQAAAGRPWWAGIAQFYRHELAQLDAKTARADVEAAGVNHLTPATITGKDGKPRPARHTKVSAA
ncbi:MAG: hypothetical protein LC121_06845 [Anaerolineae bacterium]|nr:hypothetical protein [Anaerolineae bacterium]